MDNAIGIDRSLASIEQFSFVHDKSINYSKSPAQKSSGSSGHDIIFSTNSDFNEGGDSENEIKVPEGMTEQQFMR